MTKNTTFKCPIVFSDKIKKIIEKTGMYTNEFILTALDNNLPLENVTRFKKLKPEDIEIIGVRIPDSIQSRIDFNITELSSDIRSIKQWELILHCLIKELSKEY